MKTVRIIPRLDIKGPNLVKGIHLEGLRVLGKPSDFAKYYYENNADELIFQDVVASLYAIVFFNSLKIPKLVFQICSIFLAFFLRSSSHLKIKP